MKTSNKFMKTVSGEKEIVDKRNDSDNQINNSEFDCEDRIIVLSKIKSLIMWAYEMSGSIEQINNN